MPEINGAWLDPVRQDREERASIQKKAKCYVLAQVAVKLCALGTGYSLLMIGSFNFGRYIPGFCRDMFNERNITLIRNSDSYLGQALTNLLGQGDKKEYGDFRNIDYALLGIISFYIYKHLALPRLNTLLNYFRQQYDDSINIIEAIEESQLVPDYECMKCYDQIVNVNKTSVGSISRSPVQEIEQKVFYRGEVYEYYYLLTAYATNPKGRDHTGQPYDISLFYRIEDNKIKYID
jgi:hypothetical protein